MIHLQREPSGTWMATIVPEQVPEGVSVRVTAVRGRRRLQLIDRDGRAISTKWLAQMTPAELQKFTLGRRGW